MAGNLGGQARVKCPFYIIHEPKGGKVRCVGGARGSTITMMFKNARNLDIFMQKICFDISRWEKCPYALAAAAAYKKQHAREEAKSHV